MDAKTSARRRKVAATSLGMGSACAFPVSLVSTFVRLAKNVERSGRRGGWWSELVDDSSGTLCSTVLERGQRLAELTFEEKVLSEYPKADPSDDEAYSRRMT